jgi:ankyrin repeat protein
MPINEHNALLKAGNQLGYFPADQGGCCRGMALRWIEACLTGYLATLIDNRELMASDIQNVMTLNHILIIRSLDTYELGFCNQLGKYEQRSIDDSDVLEFLHTHSAEKYIRNTAQIQKLNDILDSFGSKTLLTDDEDMLNRHVEAVLYDQDLPKKIQLVKEKVQQRESLTHHDLALFDILGFFESIKLYQDADQYPRLFDLSLNQQQIELTSQFASSTKITAQGGLVQVYSEPGIYDQDEMVMYFNNLSETIEQAGYPVDTKLGLILGSFDHAIALTYQVGRAQWRLMDINLWPATSFKNTIDLVKRIVFGFNLYRKIKSSPYTAFSTTLITTGDDPHRAQLMMRLNDFKYNHQITQAIARRQEMVNLAHIAAQTGHAYVFDALHALGEDLNMPARDEDGSTPLYLAASMNETSVISILAEYGVDLNTPVKNGLTPIYIAAQRGRMEAVMELARHGAHVDVKESSLGCYPVYIAAQFGHANIITVLADFHADLNAAINDGTTPVFIAAYFGQLDAIKALANGGANLNCSATLGGLNLTPIYVAALHGHAAIVSELADRFVPVDEIMSDGSTALFIAATMGHALIVSDLLTRGANGNITLPNGLTPLLIASLYGHTEVVRVLLQLACLSMPATSAISKQLSLKESLQDLNLCDENSDEKDQGLKRFP